jgi:hypothetical protein
VPSFVEQMDIVPVLLYEQEVTSDTFPGIPVVSAESVGL